MARTGLLLLAAVAVAVPIPLGAQVPVPTGSGLIAGQVVDEDTERGIAGVAVALVAAPQAGRGAGARRGAVYTDSQGRFYFAALASGTYMAAAQLPGYSSVVAQETVELADGARRTDLRLTLRKQGHISGVVRDDTGSPVVGVEVLALRRLSQPGRPSTLSVRGRARTDDRGIYRISNLTADTYFICACNHDPVPLDGVLLSTLTSRPQELLAISGRAAVAGADAVALERPLRTLPPTFHPQTGRASEAEPITLGGGEDRSGVDVSITSVPGSRVSGRILAAPGPVNAAFIRLRPIGDLPEAFAVTQLVPMLVQPDGRFDFAQVPPGDYVLNVNFRPGQRDGGPSGAALAFLGAGARPGGPPAPPVSDPNATGDPLWASEVISVGDQDVTGLVIGLQRSLTLSGRLQFVGAGTPPQAQALQNASVQLLSEEMGALLRSYSARVDGQGRFEVRGIVPGRYILGHGPNLSGWTTLRAVTTDGGDMTDRVIELGTSSLTNVVMTFTDTTLGRIEGRVVPVPDANEPIAVRVFPTDRKYWDELFGAVRRFRTAQVTAEGTYTIGPLPAGEYFIVAVPATPTETDIEALEALSKVADRVRVADGDTLVVEVRR